MKNLLKYVFGKHFAKSRKPKILIFCFFSFRACPLNRLVLETDGPFMAPEPWRGQTSLPWMVISVAETVAKVKKISVDQVLEQTRANVHRVYGI